MRQERSRLSKERENSCPLRLGPPQRRPSRQIHQHLRQQVTAGHCTRRLSLRPAKSIFKLNLSLPRNIARIQPRIHPMHCHPHCLFSSSILPEKRIRTPVGGQNRRMHVQETILGNVQHIRWNEAIPTGDADDVQRHPRQPVGYFRVPDLPTFETGIPDCIARPGRLAGNPSPCRIEPEGEFSRGSSSSSPGCCEEPALGNCNDRKGTLFCPLRNTATGLLSQARSLSSTIRLNCPGIPMNRVRKSFDTASTQAYNDTYNFPYFRLGADLWLA